MAINELLKIAMHEVPESIAEMLDRTFGEVTDVSSPNSVEDSLIVQGKVAANFNNAILKPLSGLPIVELALRIGQNNPTVQGMLLTMLKVTGSMGKDALTCNLKDGDSYPAGKLTIVVSTSGGTCSGVYGAFSGPENGDFEFDKGSSGSKWAASPEIVTPGDYTIDLSAEFEKRKEATYHITITEPETPQTQPEAGA